mmetsp:Transcript_9905/g.20147  ORF Transcript_9905/g.20147 Transcript_9905/m.20147 type:complete len:380 (-) Transcript_9905:476-1615(-)|eukprot:CAMPEP_0184679076 /NCGR_PEP_ID=MMETSP0312-20130426/1903_1 /TAXON_ID=31354 /ORGANISM="Compsopogon coeruleus, Strain SAG 36.94" /LENGTH=379 /DNA_ID=CAMNT_0027128299 /DNA_START=226 /DNA_END=1365 /DNA_ORIENTATION=-
MEGGYPVSSQRAKRDEVRNLAAHSGHEKIYLSFPDWYIDQVLEEEGNHPVRALLALQKDYLNVEVSIARIQRRSTKAGQQSLFESFPKWYLGWLLVQTKFDEIECWKLLQKSQRTIELLRNMEREADPLLLETLFVQGWCQVRGRDIQGRPVFWFKNFGDQEKISFPYTEHVIYHIWVVTWAMRVMEPSLIDRGLMVVINIRDLDLRSVNNALESKIGGILSSLFPVSNPGGENCVYYQNTLVNKKHDQLMDRFLARSPDGASFFQLVTSNGQDILNRLQDPSNVPTTFFDAGKSVSMDRETYGNYHDLITHQGFSNLTVRDLWFPNSPPHSESLKRRPSLKRNESNLELEIMNWEGTETLHRCRSRPSGSYVKSDFPA